MSRIGLSFRLLDCVERVVCSRLVTIPRNNKGHAKANERPAAPLGIREWGSARITVGRFTQGWVSFPNRHFPFDLCPAPPPSLPTTGVTLPPGNPSCSRLLLTGIDGDGPSPAPRRRPGAASRTPFSATTRPLDPVPAPKFDIRACDSREGR